MVKNLTIKTKLLTSFIIIALLLGIVGLMGEMNMKNMYRATDEIYNHNLEGIDELHIIKENLLYTEVALVELTYNKEVRIDNLMVESIHAEEAENEVLIESYGKRKLSVEANQSWNIFLVNLDLYRTEINRLIGFIESNDQISATVA